LKSASLQYANALADVALQQGAAEPVLKQLNDFAGAYAESAELRNFLANPAATSTEKHGVTEKIAARLGASKILRNFLFLVIDHRRTLMIPELAEAFESVIRERQGLAGGGGKGEAGGESPESPSVESAIAEGLSHEPPPPPSRLPLLVSRLPPPASLTGKTRPLSERMNCPPT
jgi:hypothetical protein